MPPLTRRLTPLLAASLSACLPSGCGGRAEGATAAPAVAISEHATALGQVTDVGLLPDGRTVIVEKAGAVKLRAAGGAVAVAGTFPVDTGSEKGLLGVAVDPAFATTRRLFLYYSRATSAGGTDLDRHRVVSVALQPDGTLGPEQVLVSGLRGPANHDGGGLAIGPDGHLYVGVGDTGCNSGAPPADGAAPTNYFATCLTNGNGKILRVALDGSVPADNPLVATAEVSACAATCGGAPAGTGAPRADLWAWGFRNPWRFAFDPATGALWVGDVGEITYEEVTIARKGRHHGWPWREGAAGWPASKCAGTLGGGGDCVDPVYACRHGAAAGGVDGDCQSITGGVFLPAPRWPAGMAGLYLFADNATRRIWTLAPTAARDGVVPGSRREVARLPAGSMPVSLRLGPDGDVYVAVLPGRVLRLSPAP